MSGSTLNKEELKEAVKEVLMEDPSFLKEIMIEIMKKEAEIEKMEDSFQNALNKVFKEHKETFIKLA